MGESLGYELIQESNINDIYVIKYFLFKFDRQPTLVKIEYYKPKENWRIHGFQVDMYFDDYIIEGTIKRIKKLGAKDKSL